MVCSLLDFGCLIGVYFVVGLVWDVDFEFDDFGCWIVLWCGLLLFCFVGLGFLICMYGELIVFVIGGCVVIGCLEWVFGFGRECVGFGVGIRRDLSLGCLCGDYCGELE